MAVRWGKECRSIQRQTWLATIPPKEITYLEASCPGVTRVETAGRTLSRERSRAISAARKASVTLTDRAAYDDVPIV